MISIEWNKKKRKNNEDNKGRKIQIYILNKKDQVFLKIYEDKMNNEWENQSSAKQRNKNTINFVDGKIWWWQWVKCLYNLYKLD